MQMYGEYHILTSRLYINMGIVYEDNNDYKKAYEFFKKWARVSEEILGPDHPKTLRAKGVLRESRYRRIARVQGEWTEDSQDDNDQNTSDDDGDEEVENPDIEHYYDDPVCQGNAPVIEMDNSIADSNFFSVSNTDNLETSFDNQDRNEDNIVREGEGDSLMNGYYDDEPTADSGSNHENSDNENFYDDNFEDYDEQYILHSDVGPVIEEFNAQVEEEEDDDEIVQISGNDCYRHIYEHDNRYASDSDSF